MENISSDHIKTALEKLVKPVTLLELAKSLDLENEEERKKLEKYLRDNKEELDIKLIEVPEGISKENNIEYVLEYREGEREEEKDEFEHLNDDELMKTYQTYIFKVNKLKDQRAKLENTEIKAKYIKALHKYNELKDIGQIVLGKLAQLQNKTVNELYEEYDLDLND